MNPEYLQARFPKTWADTVGNSPGEEVTVVGVRRLELRLLGLKVSSVKWVRWISGLYPDFPFPHISHSTILQLGGRGVGGENRTEIEGARQAMVGTGQTQ